MDEVRFQAPNGNTCRAWLAWPGDDAALLFVEDGSTAKIRVEIARAVQGGGIFHRAESYTLNQMEEDILRTLQEIASSL